MINLIKIECFKMYKSKLVIISLLVCAVAIVGFAFFLKQESSSENGDLTKEEQQLRESYEKSTDWREQLQIQMQLNKYLENIYGKDEVEAKNQILQYRIQNDIAPGKKNTTWDFITYCLEIIGFLIPVFTIIFSVEILIKEYSNKTAKLLFAKPYSRGSIIISKYLTSIIYAIMLSVFNFLIAFIVGGVCFSFDGLSTITVIKFFHTVVSCSVFTKSMIYFISVLINAVVVESIAFLLGVICRTQTLPLIAVLGILMFGNMLANKIYAAGFRIIRFSIFSNLSLSNFIDSYVRHGYSLPLFVMSVSIHIIMFLWITIAVVKRADV